MEAAKTGKIGDGKVSVIPVESAIRITEESGAEALIAFNPLRFTAAIPFGVAVFLLFTPQRFCISFQNRAWRKSKTNNLNTMHNPYDYNSVRLAVIAGTSLMAERTESALSSGDTAWMLTATVLVLFMTLPGLALLWRSRALTKRPFGVMLFRDCLSCFSALGRRAIQFSFCGWLGISGVFQNGLRRGFWRHEREHQNRLS